MISSASSSNENARNFFQDKCGTENVGSETEVDLRREVTEEFVSGLLWREICQKSTDN